VLCMRPSRRTCGQLSRTQMQPAACGLRLAH
jgi:hypothetical protein